MALILPFLLLLIFGITEFGRAWMTVNILQTASREGARLAVVTAPNVDAVVARATAICDAAAVHNAIVTCTGPFGNDPENKVTVTVTADFTVVSGKVLDSMRGTFPLSAQTTMRYEGGS